MRYVRTRIEADALDKAYRIYVTDSLKFIAENTAKFAGGSSFKMRYCDFIKKPIVETRTADEIIDSIKAKIEG